MKRFSTHFLRAFLVGVIVFIILKGLEVLNGGGMFFNEDLLMSFTYNQLYSVSLYLVNYYVVAICERRYKTKLFTPRNLAITLFLSVIATAVGIFLIRIVTEVFIGGSSLKMFLATESPVTYWITMTIATTVTIIFFIIYYKQQKREVEVKTQRIIAGSASAKFDALKNQLDPHFLFNSLNVLSSLIEENPKNAQQFTTALSKVYRYVLEQKNKELVSVAEELAFARTYSSLLKMRFEDSVIFNVPDLVINPEAKVVPLSLQLLLENAVKHNVVSVKNPLRIDIYEEAGHLVVENNLQAKEILNKRQGVGLSNIKDRYGLLTARKLKVTKTSGTFEVRLPMLTRQVSFSETTHDHQGDFHTKPKSDYERAKEKVTKMREFYGNVTSYLIVIPILAYINYVTMGWSFMWFLFPLFGWGLGILFHAMDVFDWNPFLGHNWEEKKIKSLMRKK